MPLTEIARFSTLQEAQVARSALMASGVRAFIPDEMRASVIWTEQTAIGGIRVAVFDEDENAAKTVLDAARARALKLQERSGSTIGGSPLRLSTLPVLIAAGAFGWSLAGLRRRTVFHRVSAIALMLASVLILSLPWLYRWLRR